MRRGGGGNLDFRLRAGPMHPSLTNLVLRQLLTVDHIGTVYLGWTLAQHELKPLEA